MVVIMRMIDALHAGKVVQAEEGRDEVVLLTWIEEVAMDNLGKVKAEVCREALTGKRTEAIEECLEILNGKEKDVACLDVLVEKAEGCSAHRREQKAEDEVQWGLAERALVGRVKRPVKALQVVEKQVALENLDDPKCRI